MKQLDFEQLLNWIEGRLPPEEAEKVEAIIAKDGQEIDALVDWLRRFQQLSGRIPYALVPDELQDSLNNIFTRPSAAAEKKMDFFRRLLASLSFDSYGQVAVPGLRAATPSLDRQLVYSTSVADILFDLQWNLHHKQFQINGQFFPSEETEETHYLVVLQQDTHLLAWEQTDPFGKFAFNAVPPGKYDIVLSGAQFEIAIQAIELY